MRNNKNAYKKNSAHSAETKQAVNYNATRDEVIQRTYLYGGKIAKSIRDETPVDVALDKQKLDTRLESDASKKGNPCKQFELEFDIKLEQWIKTKYIVKDNEVKAH